MEARLIVSLNFLLFLAVVRGFSPVVVHKIHGSIKSPDLYTTRLLESEVDTRDDVKISGRKDFLALIGTIVTSSIVSIGAPVMAEEIKTFDLSLPSYDSINTLKITEETEKALGVETPTGKSTAKASKKNKTKQKRDNEDTGNNPLSSILPSMNKTSVKKSKPQKTAEKASKPEKDQKLKYETMDMSLPSYSTNTKPEEKDFFSI